METKGQLCSKGPLECGGRCEVHVVGSYYLKYRTCELPSLTLHEHKTVQPTLSVMSANRNSSLHVPYPLCKCREGSLCAHALQLELAPNAWGVVRAHPASNSVQVDDQARYRVATICCNVGSIVGKRSYRWGSVHEPRRANTVRNQLVRLLGLF